MNDDIRGYVAANPMLSELYKTNASVHACVNNVEIMGGTSEDMLLVIIQTLALYNIDIFNKLIDIQSKRLPEIIIECEQDEQE